jgi:hypothetical protein
MYRKKSPQKFKSVFEKALSCFPELHDTYVWIHEKSLFGVQHTLRAYPPFVVLHWPKKKWVYPIVINKNKTKNLSFYNLTQDEQVGLILHELSHISVYIKCTRMDIAKYYMYKYSTNKVWVRRNGEGDGYESIYEKGGGRVTRTVYDFIFDNSVSKISILKQKIHICYRVSFWIK